MDSVREWLGEVACLIGLHHWVRRDRIWVPFDFRERWQCLRCGVERTLYLNEGP